ncbi:CTK1 [Candida jiufengensis]|uniref:CTK1 n=1 Tax=Candida jiufengensis TaxID=497108 RepID=UPI0022253631|nr:CTK1 [Candida jiufengensis]KAI5952761.1 CTK1 [Candida jiufengensis]
MSNRPRGPRQQQPYQNYHHKQSRQRQSDYRDRDEYYSNSRNYNSGPPKGPRNFQQPPKRPSNFPTGPSNKRRRDDSYSSRSSYIPKAPPEEDQLEQRQIYSITSKSTSFEKIKQVGQGTYGKVYKASNTITKEIVAMKMLKLENEREGFPITAIREIKLLQSFDHPNIVSLLELMIEKNYIYMVFDYLEHDLTGLLSQVELNNGHRKNLFHQLLEGLNYLHKKRIIHRDIKGSNILIDSKGKLKIADFGLARTIQIGEVHDFTNRVITLWYRPPELLLGATNYSTDVDIWGIGCLLLELYTKIAVFRGMDEISQLQSIFNLVGTPTTETWPQIASLPWYEMLKPKINITSKLKTKFKDILGVDAFELAENLLQLNPEKRYSAEEALAHVYFKNDPQPQPLEFLADFKHEWHEFETKEKRREERKKLKELEDAAI